MSVEYLNKYVCEECGERLYTPFVSYPGINCIACMYANMLLVDLVPVNIKEDE